MFWHFTLDLQLEIHLFGSRWRPKREQHKSPNHEKSQLAFCEKNLLAFGVVNQGLPS